MTTTWTIAIDWDRDGEFAGDDIVTNYTVWVNWFLGFRKSFMDIAENLYIFKPNRTVHEKGIHQKIVHH